MKTNMTLVAAMALVFSSSVVMADVMSVETSSATVAEHKSIVLVGTDPLLVKLAVTINASGVAVPSVTFLGNGDSRNSSSVLDGFESEGGHFETAVYGTPTSRFTVFTGFLREGRTLILNNYYARAKSGAVVGDVGVMYDGDFSGVDLRGTAEKTQGHFSKVSTIRYLRPASVAFGQDSDGFYAKVKPSTIGNNSSYMAPTSPDDIAPNRVIIDCNFGSQSLNATTAKWHPTTETVAIPVYEGLTRKRIVQETVRFPANPAFCAVYTVIRLTGTSGLPVNVGIRQGISNPLYFPAVH